MDKLEVMVGDLLADRISKGVQGFVPDLQPENVKIKLFSGELCRSYQSC
jgi:hypothetical protein